MKTTLRSGLFISILLALLVSLTPSFSTRVQADKTEMTCGYHEATAKMLSLTNPAAWADWIARLSGELPVTIAGQQTVIATRFSISMFNDQSNARAFDYVLEQVSRWYPASQIEVDPFPDGDLTWKNLIVTIPGSIHPDEVVVLSAHLDSRSENDATSRVKAPGAEDNASGSAALLEAARVFRYFRFDRTLRIIWFTGEEQGLIGSRAYVQDHDIQNVIANFNLDMFGYDQDDDRCIELHVGTLPKSQAVGGCFTDTIAAYNLNLKLDYIDSYDMLASDHASFWRNDIGAVEVLENHFFNSAELGCAGLQDDDPNYHTQQDTLNKLNLSSGFEVVRASLAATAEMSGITEPCFNQPADLAVNATPGAVDLNWSPVPGAVQYRLYRSEQRCSSGNGMQLISLTEDTFFHDSKGVPGREYAYQLEAVGAGGACFSIPSLCQQAAPQMISRFPRVIPR